VKISVNKTKVTLIISSVFNHILGRSFWDI